MDEEAAPSSAFRFDGRWTEFASIAFTNLLLTTVTLGIYRFWATARERRYLWEHTSFIDDRLEWTGTGGELFKGFLLALVLFIVPYVGLNFVTQALFLRGRALAAILLTIAMLAWIFYLFGVATYRALRYRLARTFWRGIRGGSDDPGWDYGLIYMWKTAAGILPLGLLIPWSMTSLWNERWNRLSFGPLPFRAAVTTEGLMGRFLLCYLAPFLLLGAAGYFISTVTRAAMTGVEPGPGMILAIFVVMLAAYFGFGLVLMAYYAKYFRHAIGATTLGDLQFGFTARTWDWVRLMVGNVLLVIFTFGIGLIFLNYRNWRFFIRHMEASGTIDPADLTQSTTRELRQGEGLLDAFDMGAL